MLGLSGGKGTIDMSDCGKMVLALGTLAVCTRLLEGVRGIVMVSSLMRPENKLSRVFFAERWLFCSAGGGGGASLVAGCAGPAFCCDWHMSPPLTDTGKLMFFF